MDKLLNILLEQLHHPSSLEDLKCYSDFIQQQAAMEQTASLFPIPEQSIDFLPRIIDTATQIVSMTKNNEKQLFSADWFELNKLWLFEPKQAESDRKQFVEICEGLATLVESTNVSRSLCGYLSKLGQGILEDVSSNSAFPDLVRVDNYDFLPVSNKESEKESMPSWKGGRVTNTPDGAECKTTRGSSIKIDAHGPKTGLFFVLLWDIEKRLVINDIYMAFLNRSNFRKGNVNSESTTIKWNPTDLSLFTNLDGNPYRGQPALFS